MTAALTIHVLIVDDDRTFREPLRQYLARQEGEVRFEVEALARAAEVLKLGEQVRRFEVALIDQMLESEDEPPLTGTELMVRLKARAPDLEVVIMTGWGVQAEVGIESIRRGAYRYFAKFSQPEEIPLLVRAAYERREWRRLAGERDQAAAAAEAERRRAAEMETLNEIGRRIASVPGLDELPHLIFRETSRVLDTTNFFVAYYDGATDENDFRLRYEHGAELPPLRISAKRGLSGWVVRQRQRLFLPDGSRDFREREGIELVGEEARSWLGVPILSGDRVLGVIGAQEYEQTGKFDANHEKVLGVIASFAAAAMENAQAMARLRQEQDRYRRMVASSFDGILVVGRDGRLTECNPSAERILGYSRDELLGRSVGDLYSDLATGRRVNKLLHTNPDQRVTGERADVVSRNGEVIPIELSASLLFDAEGREIGSAGYFEDLRQRQILETRFDDLLEAVKGIASLLEPEPLASLILSTACKAIPVATKGSLHLYDSEIKQLIPSALYRYPAHLIELARFAPGEGFASEVFETGVPARISDASQDRRVKHLPEPALRSGSAICVPLIYQDASLGTLSLDNPEQLDAFTDDDVHLLEKYADMAAIALVNARRFHRSTQDLHAVQTVDGLLGHATHLDVTLELVVSVAQRQTNSDRTELYALVQPDAGQASLRLLAAAGGPAQPDVAFSRPLPTDDHAIAHVLMEGQTAQERQSNGDWRLVAPLKSPEGKPVGLLVLTREGAMRCKSGKASCTARVWSWKTRDRRRKFTESWLQCACLARKSPILWRRKRLW
ncbi:MAG: GAF domain-containing protein [Chloroflexi bacterium]|nr:GAF domain-containing protein [Chloroflexota bacterium]